MRPRGADERPLTPRASAARGLYPPWRPLLRRRARQRRRQTQNQNARAQSTTQIANADAQGRVKAHARPMHPACVTDSSLEETRHTHQGRDPPKRPPHPPHPPHRSPPPRNVAARKAHRRNMCANQRTHRTQMCQSRPCTSGCSSSEHHCQSIACGRPLASSSCTSAGPQPEQSAARGAPAPGGESSFH